MPAFIVNIPTDVPYDPVPPVALTVTVDVPLLQSIGVKLEEATTCVGAAIVPEMTFDEHPLASVTVKL